MGRRAGAQLPPLVEDEGTELEPGVSVELGAGAAVGAEFGVEPDEGPGSALGAALVAGPGIAPAAYLPSFLKLASCISTLQREFP